MNDNMYSSQISQLGGVSSIKIYNKKEIHVYRGPQQIETVTNFIKIAFKKRLPQNYILTYKDEDGDNITVNCDEDVYALVETQKSPKLWISEPFTSSSDSETETEKKPQQQKKEKQNPQQEQQQQKKPEEFINDLLKNGIPPEIKEFGKQFGKEFKKQMKEQKGETQKCPFKKNNEQKHHHRFWGQNQQQQQQDIETGLGNLANLFQGMFQQQGQQQQNMNNLFQNMFKPQQQQQQQKQEQQQQPEYKEDKQPEQPEKQPEEPEKQSEEPEKQPKQQGVEGNIFIDGECIDDENVKKSTEVVKVKEEQEKSKNEVQICEEQQDGTEKVVETVKQEEQKEKIVKHKLSSKYTPVMKARAVQIADIFGGNSEQFLGVCEYYSKDSADYIVGELMQNLELVNAFPTQYE